MAKLYAELTSDKGGRVASKGGDAHIELVVRQGNKTIGLLEITEIANTLKVWYTNSDYKSHLIEEIKLT